MRFVNDSQEAPNLQLVYWPPFEVARGIMPTRAFLVANHDIPARVELTFDYGKHYPRTWLGGGTNAACAPESSAASLAPTPQSDAAPIDEESVMQQATELWSALEIGVDDPTGRADMRGAAESAHAPSGMPLTEQPQTAPVVVSQRMLQCVCTQCEQKLRFKVKVNPTTTTTVKVPCAKCGAELRCSVPPASAVANAPHAPAADGVQPDASRSRPPPLAPEGKRMREADDDGRGSNDLRVSQKPGRGRPKKFPTPEELAAQGGQLKPSQKAALAMAKVGLHAADGVAEEEEEEEEEGPPMKLAKVKVPPPSEKAKVKAPGQEVPPSRSLSAAVPALERAPMPPPSWLVAGARVEARFRASIPELRRKSTRFYPGFVDEVNPDGTCNIKYDDGDFERGMPAEFVRQSNRPTQCLQAQMAEVISVSEAVGSALGSRRTPVAQHTGGTDADATLAPVATAECNSLVATAVCVSTEELPRAAAAEAEEATAALGGMGTRTCGLCGDLDELPKHTVAYDELVVQMAEALHSRDMSQRAVCSVLALNPFYFSGWLKNKPMPEATRRRYSAAAELWLADSTFAILDPTLTNTSASQVPTPPRGKHARPAPMAASCDADLEDVEDDVEDHEEEEEELVTYAGGFDLVMGKANTGYKGVSLVAKTGRYRAYYGRDLYLGGDFPTAVEAATAYARHHARVTGLVAANVEENAAEGTGQEVIAQPDDHDAAMALGMDPDDYDEDLALAMSASLVTASAALGSDSVKDHLKTLPSQHAPPVSERAPRPAVRGRVMMEESDDDDSEDGSADEDDGVEDGDMAVPSAADHKRQCGMGSVAPWRSKRVQTSKEAAAPACDVDASEEEDEMPLIERKRRRTAESVAVTALVDDGATSAPTHRQEPPAAARVSKAREHFRIPKRSSANVNASGPPPVSHAMVAEQSPRVMGSSHSRKSSAAKDKAHSRIPSTSYADSDGMITPDDDDDAEVEPAFAARPRTDKAAATVAPATDCDGPRRTEEKLADVKLQWLSAAKLLMNAGQSAVRATLEQRIQTLRALALQLHQELGLADTTLRHEMKSKLGALNEETMQARARQEMMQARARQEAMRARAQQEQVRADEVEQARAKVQAQAQARMQARAQEFARQRQPARQVDGAVPPTGRAHVEVMVPPPARAPDDSVAVARLEQRVQDAADAIKPLEHEQQQKQAMVTRLAGEAQDAMRQPEPALTDLSSKSAKVLGQAGRCLAKGMKYIRVSPAVLGARLREISKSPVVHRMLDNVDTEAALVHDVLEGHFPAGGRVIPCYQLFADLEMTMRSFRVFLVPNTHPPVYRIPQGTGMPEVEVTSDPLRFQMLDKTGFLESAADFHCIYTRVPAHASVQDILCAFGAHIQRAQERFSIDAQVLASQVVKIGAECGVNAAAQFTREQLECIQSGDLLCEVLVPVCHELCALYHCIEKAVHGLLHGEAIASNGLVEYTLEYHVGLAGRPTRVVSVVAEDPRRWRLFEHTPLLDSHAGCPANTPLLDLAAFAATNTLQPAAKAKIDNAVLKGTVMVKQAELASLRQQLEEAKAQHASVQRAQRERGTSLPPPPTMSSAAPPKPWLVKGKNPSSCLHEFVQALTSDNGSSALAVNFDVREDGDPTKRVKCLVHFTGASGSGGTTVGARMHDRQSAKSVASHRLMLRLCPEYAQVHSKRKSVYAKAAGDPIVRAASTAPPGVLVPVSVPEDGTVAAAEATEAAAVAVACAFLRAQGRQMAMLSTLVIELNTRVPKWKAGFRKASEWFSTTGRKQKFELTEQTSTMMVRLLNHSNEQRYQRHRSHSPSRRRSSSRSHSPRPRRNRSRSRSASRSEAAEERGRPARCATRERGRSASRSRSAAGERSAVALPTTPESVQLDAVLRWLSAADDDGRVHSRSKVNPEELQMLRDGGHMNQPHPVILDVVQRGTQQHTRKARESGFSGTIPETILACVKAAKAALPSSCNIVHNRLGAYLEAFPEHFECKGGPSGTVRMIEQRHAEVLASPSSHSSVRKVEKHMRRTISETIRNTEGGTFAPILQLVQQLMVQLGADQAEMSKVLNSTTVNPSSVLNWLRKEPQNEHFGVRGEGFAAQVRFLSETAMYKPGSEQPRASAIPTASAEANEPRAVPLTIELDSPPSHQTDSRPGGPLRYDALPCVDRIRSVAAPGAAPPRAAPMIDLALIRGSEVGGLRGSEVGGIQIPSTTAAVGLHSVPNPIAQSPVLDEALAALSAYVNQQDGCMKTSEMGLFYIYAGADGERFKAAIKRVGMKRLLGQRPDVPLRFDDTGQHFIRSVTLAVAPPRATSPEDGELSEGEFRDENEWRTEGRLVNSEPTQPPPSSALPPPHSVPLPAPAAPPSMVVHKPPPPPPRPAPPPAPYPQWRPMNPPPRMAPPGQQPIPSGWAPQHSLPPLHGVYPPYAPPPLNPPPRMAPPGQQPIPSGWAPQHSLPPLHGVYPPFAPPSLVPVAPLGPPPHLPWGQPGAFPPGWHPPPPHGARPLGSLPDGWPPG